MTRSHLGVDLSHMQDVHCIPPDTRVEGAVPAAASPYMTALSCQSKLAFVWMSRTCAAQLFSLRLRGGH